MARTTIKRLEALMGRAVKLTGRALVLDSNAGGKRIMSPVGEHGGVTNVSPRLPSGKLELWLEGYISGAEDANREEVRA